jgi:hypothetical protein
MEAAGAVKVTWAPVKQQTRSVHLLGTCRMGNDAATSVVDRYHRSHDIPNLFVCDGSSLVTSGRGLPTLTIQALASAPHRELRAPQRYLAAASLGHTRWIASNSDAQRLEITTARLIRNPRAKTTVAQMHIQTYIRPEKWTTSGERLYEMRCQVDLRPLSSGLLSRSRFRGYASRAGPDSLAMP